MQDILIFINKFKCLYPKEMEETFSCGNSYWFAQILCMEFSECELFYLPKKNYFIVGYDNRYFDITGVVMDIDEVPYLWANYVQYDSFDAERVLSVCKDLKD